MKYSILLTRVSPLTTIQDKGRFDCLQYGISASGAMDKNAFDRGAYLLGTKASSGVEFTQSGLDFTIKGKVIRAAFTGGNFTLFINSRQEKWNRAYNLKQGAKIEIKPGAWGNYGYVRFNGDLDVKEILGSRATNIKVALGGLDGRALKAGDDIAILPSSDIEAPNPPTLNYEKKSFHFIWGIHADLFNQKVRNEFISKPFFISSQLDRMGVRLLDKNSIFANENILSLVSDPLICGDIQILGDGTPIVLMRDHQTIGGYPRIGTIISTDIDAFAQLRPNSEINFKPISIGNL
ncbi:MAG: biotin-dependent carboxyltransferase family protein [Devosiaceae bacterium]|nr:biotin-dependent carboxyltransferase family protein [Devosiaceae bacterium]